MSGRFFMINLRFLFSLSLSCSDIVSLVYSEAKQSCKNGGAILKRYGFILVICSLLILGWQIVPLTAQDATPSEDIVTQFAIIGDYGAKGDAEQAVADMVKSWNPDFIITLGDNNYFKGSPDTIDKNIGAYYADYIFPYNGSYQSDATENRFFPALGNHDWMTNDAQAYFDYFSLPNNERYYDFVWKTVHFFVVDSDTSEPDGVTKGSVQYEWLRHGLTTSESQWNIVYFHHPPYSSSLLHPPSKWMRWPFQAWGADIVLSGHAHQYERLLVDNFPYIVNGLGGQSARPFGIIAPESIFRYTGNYGAQRVTVYQNEMLFEFFSIENGGTLVDSYTLQKNNLMPAPLATSTPAS